MSLIKLTEKKLAANRANAKKSTGPRTAAGKAATRFNALQHGFRSREIILPELGESVDDFRAFRAALLTDLAPPSPIHASLAEEFVATFWFIRRARRLQTRHEQEAAQKAIERFPIETGHPVTEPHMALARELAKPGRLQNRYFRLINHGQRLHHSAHRTLARFYKLPYFVPEPETPNSPTIQPKTPLLSTLPVAAALLIFAFLLATLTPIATAAQTFNSQTFQPISCVFSSRTANLHKPRTLSHRHSPFPATVKDLVIPFLVIG